MNDGKATAAIFLDLKKAFDTVNHCLLIEKLKHIGIKDNTLNWFISYLSNRSQVVSINSSLSDSKYIDIGVPQGSILGPLLFIIFVNSLADCVSCKCVMYADDTTLLCSSKDSLTLQSELNANLNSISKWLNVNKLTLTINKTKLMIFGTKHTLRNFKNISLAYDTDIVERVDNFKYLGVVFDPQLAWSNHIDQLTYNVSKRIGIIQRIKYYLPSSTLNLLVNALVMPLIDYCNSVWSNCNVQYSNSLQILHNRLARILLSADSRTSVNDLMTKLSWNKLEQRWNDQLLITTFKCLQGNAPSYLSSNFLFSDSAHSMGTWSQTFQCLLLPLWKTNPGRRSFHFRAVNRWNKLSNYIRLNFSTMTTHIFLNAISAH